MDSLDSVPTHGKADAGACEAVFVAAVEDDRDVAGNVESFFAADFEGVEADCSGDSGYALGVFLEAQQIDNADFFGGVQFCFQLLRGEAKVTEQPNLSHDGQELPDE